ncbi:MAG: cupin domain-containing protein [Rhodopseudomonas sp.]|uniref:cupin domain-containing protein n=1 Tax=Rhodopseudomonas sp. TaxID=1078 RepID=UPI0017CA7A50|nr:cupin domain-containing protein [Rhodopseudomonas sp.]NVN88676.1 cupin domain-containing protein [Rhodopseudomonas sp.]
MATARTSARSGTNKKTAAPGRPDKPAAKSMAKLVTKSAVRSKAMPPAKPPAKPASKPAAPSATKARPKQRVAISHLREDDFVANGLRAYAQYRDLGIARASHGLAQAHVIRLIGPCNPAEVSKLHFHDVEFQMVYVLSGWVKADLEGHGEILMREGSCWTQPPRIRHKINDYSDNCELLEVILPAEFETVELTAAK